MMDLTPRIISAEFLRQLREPTPGRMVEHYTALAAKKRDGWPCVAPEDIDAIVVTCLKVLKGRVNPTTLREAIIEMMEKLGHPVK